MSLPICVGLRVPDASGAGTTYGSFNVPEACTLESASAYCDAVENTGSGTSSLSLTKGAIATQTALTATLAVNGSNDQVTYDLVTVKSSVVNLAAGDRLNAKYISVGSAVASTNIMVYAVLAAPVRRPAAG